MRHRIVYAALIAFVSVATTATHAADLKPVYKAPPAVTTYSWTGWYMGLNVGYGWSDNDATLAPSPDNWSQDFWNPAFNAGAAPSRFNISPDGFVGGGQIGYNWQSGVWVFGWEADFQGADVSGSHFIATSLGPVFAPGQFNGSQRLDWFGTVRGRVGWAANNVLAYVTGGMAYGHVKFGLNFAFPAADDFQTISASETAVGYALGGGVEWAAWSNWTLRLEYLYMDLGDESLISVPSGRAPNLASTLTMDFENRYHIVRAALNYKFDYGKAPVVAKY